MDKLNLWIQRAAVVLALLCLAGTAGAAHASSVVPTVLVEQTYLKAKPGKRADLIRFIKANWFAMDQLGVERGLFTYYRLYEDIDNNADWDLVMAVGYPQAEGYEQPATKAGFTAIRKAHVEILVDGQGLKQLGDIVRHHRLKTAG